VNWADVGGACAMNEHLKIEYEEYLARHGLKPRTLPPRSVQEAIMRETTRIMYEAARLENDPTAEDMLINYEQKRNSDLADPRHPASINIEQVATEVEATIRSLPAFAGKLRDDVFVGELPTGSVESQTVKVDGGFLILVNSGMFALLKQVVNFLWHQDVDRATDGIAEVLATYVEYGDPFYGPRPLSGGLRAAFIASMSHAALKFVIAHEYAHILAGHFAEPEAPSANLETSAGPSDMMRKNYAQEFEADDIGYKLTLEVSEFEDFDLTAIDAANAGDATAMIEGGQRKCLIAAPFVSLAIDAVLVKFFDISGRADQASRDSHPHPIVRLKRLNDSAPGTEAHRGFIGLPFLLLSSAHRIVARMNAQISRSADSSNDEIEPTSHDRGAKWFEEIMRCVDALRAADAATAALELADAFENQRTAFEPDVDVVRREIVRAVLGRQWDVRNKLLDRQRERSMLEEYFASAANFPASIAGRSGNSRHLSLGALGDLAIPDPKGLGLVSEVVRQTKLTECLGPEVHLIDSLIAAWSDQREQALTALEAACSAGVADPESRLRDFVELEKRALNLGVQLDLRQLVARTAAMAISNEAAAREVASLVTAYSKYLDFPLPPLAQRIIDVRLLDDA
jgi:hypothetical protein